MVYDGAAHRVEDEADFLRWMSIADETGRPLFLNLGAPQFHVRDAAGLLQFFENPAPFETVEHLFGFDPATDRTVKRYIPGSYQP